MAIPDNEDSEITITQIIVSDENCAVIPFKLQFLKREYIPFKLPKLQREEWLNMYCAYSATGIHTIYFTPIRNLLSLYYELWAATFNDIYHKILYFSLPFLTDIPLNHNCIQ